MIINMSGGRSGDTLTVTTPGAGITVTVSKDGKSKTKVSGADGTAVFKGLEGGTWTVTMTDGSQTAQKTVAVTTDYAVALTFFAATINVTYPAGSVCTATDGAITLTAPDTSGTWACVVPNAGTWTVTVDNVISEAVAITSNGQTKTIDKWYLYNSGDQRTSNTGGWIATKVLRFTGYEKQNISVTYGSSNMYVGPSGSGILHTQKKINLTNWSTLKFVGTIVKGEADEDTAIGVWSNISEKMKSTDNRAAAKIGAVSGSATIDISSLSGEYYVGIHLCDMDLGNPTITCEQMILM